MCASFVACHLDHFLKRSACVSRPNIGPAQVYEGRVHDLLKSAVSAPGGTAAPVPKEYGAILQLELDQAMSKRCETHTCGWSSRPADSLRAVPEGWQLARR